MDLPSSQNPHWRERVRLLPGSGSTRKIRHEYTQEGAPMKRRARSPRPISDVEQQSLPKYSIGVVSKLIGVSPQMLRRYEEAGLVEPARQTGKNRLYSDQDVATLKEIAELADQGVNAVGIQ